jgi:hypothetical protein
MLNEESADHRCSDDKSPEDEMHHPLEAFLHERDFSQFELETMGLDSAIEDIEIAAKFIEELKHATLDGSNMHLNDVTRLREAPKDFPFDVHDPDFVFSLRTFLCHTLSQTLYPEHMLCACLIYHPL